MSEKNQIPLSKAYDMLLAGVVLGAAIAAILLAGTYGWLNTVPVAVVVVAYLGTIVAGRRMVQTGSISTKTRHVMVLGAFALAGGILVTLML